MPNRLALQLGFVRTIFNDRNEATEQKLYSSSVLSFIVFIKMYLFYCIHSIIYFLLLLKILCFMKVAIKEIHLCHFYQIKEKVYLFNKYNKQGKTKQINLLVSFFVTFSYVMDQYRFVIHSLFI